MFGNYAPLNVCTGTRCREISFLRRKTRLGRTEWGGGDHVAIEDMISLGIKFGNLHNAYRYVRITRGVFR